MLIIGLAGGVGSGKSFVARCFQELGAVVLDADRIGHEVLDEPEIQKKLTGNWGDQLLSGGSIDRKKLARIVFGPDADASELLRLEEITHPSIRAKLETSLDDLRSGGKNPAVVLDAPIMFRAGWHGFCDKIVFVDTTLRHRQQRTAERGWEANEVEKREARQWPLDKKRSLSTDVIDNTGTLEDTRKQVTRLWARWNLIDSGQVPQ